MKIRFRTGWNHWKEGDVVESVTPERRKELKAQGVGSITEEKARDLVAKQYADEVPSGE